ncbi:MAG: class I SAM-dependent methyltransferase [Euryarchaeota archaeon]|nr:class I SAM-dependent methyltransferase [Euryarchaeota archaeon]
MVPKDVKEDKQFPLFVHYNPVRRLFFSNPKKYCQYVSHGHVVADLGCGPGYFTFSLAEAVGPEGTVYAVDSDAKAIRALERRAKKRGYHNIKIFTSSATDLSFIKDGSVAPWHHNTRMQRQGKYSAFSNQTLSRISR